MDYGQRAGFFVTELWESSPNFSTVGAVFPLAICRLKKTEFPELISGRRAGNLRPD